MKFSYSLIKKLLPQAPAKAKLAEALNSHSFEVESFDGDCLDISLASNRYSDAASHLGIAREGAAGLGLSAQGGSVSGGKLKNPVKKIINLPLDMGFLNVEVKEKSLCPRYAARYFEVKRISASPAWLQKILKTCGLKPINTVVDTMNYVMLEVGQPLHAFDFDKIKSANPKSPPTPRLRRAGEILNPKKIIIRKAKNGEKIETLDGQKFVLDGNDLVIADSKKALAIAGIKGGANSGVDKNTKRIIVEAANFEPVGVFKTSRKLKLITDASLRFDHGLSPALVDWGLDRATELLVKMGAKLIDSVDIYPHTTTRSFSTGGAKRGSSFGVGVYPKPARFAGASARRVGEELIEFDTKKYEHLIGASVSVNAAKNYFRALGFSVEAAKTKNENSFLVRVPAWRTDIEQFEDLAEEISRLSGYGKLQPQSPAVGLKPATEENIIILKDRIRELLLHFHLDEVYNYSFVSDADLRRPYADQRGKSQRESAFSQRESALVELQNPVSKDFPYLLSNLEGGLLKNIAFNSRFFDTIRIFEIGNVFQKKGGAVGETLHLGIALSAKKEPLILELKGIADEMLKGLGIMDVSFVESGNSLRVESDHQVIASLKLLHLEKGRTASIAEFDLEKLLPLVEEEREFKPLPKYPAVVRDISILVGSDVRIGGILEAIQKASPALIEDVDLIDEYTKDGNPRESAPRSLTFRILFQAEDRTLTDEEVDEEMKKISAKLKKDFRAEIR